MKSYDLSENAAKILKVLRRERWVHSAPEFKRLGMSLKEALNAADELVEAGLAGCNAPAGGCEFWAL